MTRKSSVARALPTTRERERARPAEDGDARRLMENILKRIRFFATRNQPGNRRRDGAPDANLSHLAHGRLKSAGPVALNIEKQSMREREVAADGPRYRPAKHNQSHDGAEEPRATKKEAQAELEAQGTELAPGEHAVAPRLYDCLTPMTRSRLNTLAQIGEDWLYLALLGTIMAVLSLSMDFVITIFLGTRIWLSEETSEQNWLLQYLAWCVTPILLVTFSTGFVHLCSPTAIGSGIPEMKTILRGVVLNEYLTFRTLIAKIVGLTFTLGSGLPLGKEGPSVHMASIVATLLSKLVASFQGIYENESRTSEMLSAACAVGVAATFYAPIGGVLFSIEVTTVYFAVRNYWRGFFAACCGATIWRLLGFYIKNDESISAIFKTNFSTDYPFDPIELLVFSFIGATCGLLGAAYIKFHREIVQFFRRHKRISGFLKQNRFVYPTLVTLIITTSSFPPLLGKYTAGTLSTHTTIEHLFSNRTWSLGSQDLVSKRILDQWTTDHTNFYLHLVLYIVMLFWTSALASTIPTPSGVFIPVVKMGAAYGRLIGELMASAYPNGIKYSHPAAIVPGSYAVVGAAAFSGAVTHTVSTSVILFEMTGQIVHIIPVILGVLISNAVCQSLQPSIYDSIIEIKKLPYLPPIASSNSISHRILVKDFMNTNIPFVWKERCSYANLKALLSAHRKIISFPLVESPDTMKLLGSVARPDLLKLLYLHLGRERRLQEVCRRNSDTLAPALHLLNTISGRLPDNEPRRQIESPLAINNQTVGDDQSSPSDKPEDSDDGGIEFKRLRRSESDLKSPREQLSSNLAGVSTRDADGKRTSSSPLAELELDRNLREPTLERNCNTNVYHCDATRLIISASKRPLNNYGATEEPGRMLKRTDKQAPMGEGLLLSECQKELLAHEEEEYKQFNSVAKIINQYDRGSSMDEEHLDKSIQHIEGHLARVAGGQAPPEIVVVVSQGTSSSPAGATGEPPTGQLQTGRSPVEPLDNGRLKPPSETVDEVNLMKLRNHRDQCRATTAAATRIVKSQPMSASRTSNAPNRLSVTSNYSHAPSGLLHPNTSSPSLSSRPTKSILKTSSFNSSHSKLISPSHSFTNSYDSKLMLGHRYTNPMSNIKFTLAPGDQRGSTTTTNNNSNLLLGSMEMGQQDEQRLVGDQTAEAAAAPPRQRRKVILPRLRVVDMTPEEQEQWEKEQLNAYIDITKCQIDEAPFQLVEQTSLYRVHTLFSMLGLNHAYVTSFGRLVGIVALKDIRFAIEKMLREK